MNNFREWLSDNLRYILLLAGILAVLLALFFGVRTLTGGGKLKESQGEETQETEKTELTEQVTQKTEEQTAPTATPKADHGKLTENADPQVSKLISDYYAALEGRNVAAVRTMTDTLPEDDAVAIEGSTTKYSDIHVYTKDGPAPGSLVAFASYKYQNENQPSPLPGLAEMLVKKAADGSWKISYAERDEATQAYMDSVKEDEDVKALIAEVTKEYQEAAKAVEELVGDNSAAKDKTSDQTDEDSGDKKEESADASKDGEEAASEGNENADENAEDEDAELESLEVYDEENAEESGEGTDEAEAEASEEESSGGRGAEILSSCNVRSGPGYEYKVLGEVRTGTYVTVIGELEDGWWHIQTDGLEGYVGRKFIPEA